MCEFCVQHGEGKKWYLQAKNYSADLINEERIRYVFDFANSIEAWAAGWASDLNSVITTDPSSTPAFVARRTEEFKRMHYGQIVPVEDVEQILGMTASIVRFACICRSALCGRYDARYCYGVTPDLPFLSDFYGLYPDFSRDLEVLSKDQAMKDFRNHDREGMVHSIWTFITPFVGVICNCTTRDCIPLLWRSRVGFSLFFKAEYAARIDTERCIGCRDCMRQCNFGAISYSATLEKCYVVMCDN